MAVSTRSTLEEILESLKRSDEKPKDLPPALPQRPNSRARLPSSLRNRKAVGAITDALPRAISTKPSSSPENNEQDVAQENGNGLEEHKYNGLSDVEVPVIHMEANGQENEGTGAETDSAYAGINEAEELTNEDDLPNLLDSTKSPSTVPLASESVTTKNRAAARKRWREDGLKKNSRVWCRSTLGDWVLGIVQSVEEAGSVISVSDGQVIKSEPSKVLPANPDILEGVDDLIQLSYLNEPAVLHNLKYRYSQDVIYTKAGPVLIAINPFKRIPIYSSEFIEMYRQRSKDNLSPHVYVTADSAYKEMAIEGLNQSIIISGESGAGKTETAKIAMQYLAALGGGGGVENEILETNPILEAFGNAKTLRNNNSSRFGKLIDIFFDNSGKICGAKIQTYLLEKSRVVHQAPGERSYHIFYQLCAGADAALRERLKLRHASEYYYLNQGGCLEIDNVDDAEHFRRMLNAMNIVQISNEDQEKAFEMLAAVLWLGNVAFSINDNENHVTVIDNEAVQVTASLLYCNVQALILALCTHKIHARNEDIVQKLTYAQAVDARDALAKAIYANLFDWLVERINISMEVGKRRTGRSISILDIYGFESFKKNSFEQLCINYANERLQQHFNRHLFKLEQEEYSAEGVDWTRVEFIDNQECLDLIEKKPLGLVSLLDEECTFPRSTEFSLAMKLNKHLSSNSCFKIERDAGFTIRHYAGEVTYDTSGIMEKNRDVLHTDLLELLSSCNSSLARGFYTKSGEASRGLRQESQKQSVSTKFKGQLFKLMQRLENTSPHFIRCVKPNSYQTPDTFDHDLVLQQLRCCGVLEVVRITRSGYPSRYLHQHFASRFGFLLQKKPSTEADPLSVCVSILQQFSIPPEMYQVGITKLFFRAGQIAILEDTRLRTLRGIVGVQKVFRGYRARCNFKRLCKATLYWQSLFRGMRARVAFRQLKHRHCAAIVIQKHTRRMLAKISYNNLRQRQAATTVIQKHIKGRIARLRYSQLRQKQASVIVIQKNVRSFQARKRFMQSRRRYEAAIVIQKNMKCVTVRKNFKRTRQEVILIQSVTRQWLARKSFKQKREQLILAKHRSETLDHVPPAAATNGATLKNIDSGYAVNKILSSELLEWQSRATTAEKALQDKEAENAALVQKLHQYETRWTEYEAKMNSMEEVWQKQMASLQLSLAAAKKSLTTDEPVILPTKSEDSVQNFSSRNRASRHVLPHDEDLDWDDPTSVGTKTPEQSLLTPHQTSSDNIPREFDAGNTVVSQLVKEYEHRTQVFTDDADFLVEVKSGQVEANLSPEDELKKLKQRFDVWKKDFKGRIRETKVILQKLSHMDSSERSKKKWWGKRTNQ